MSRHPNRVLIVDDDPDICASLQDILNDVGYETFVAGTGEAALEYVQAKTDRRRIFDLCIIDFKMPGMDGVELVKLLRETQPGIPAIMVTAYAGDDGVQRAEEAGAWRILRKPVDVSRLLGMIDDAVT